jgi:hypothetical protein
MTDSVLAVSSKVFNSVSDIDLDIVARCRAKSLPWALSITGGGPGQDLLKAITIRLRIERTGASRFGRPALMQGDTSPVRLVLS